MAAAETIDLDAVRRELIEAGAYLGSQRYHVALAGNISARVAEDSFLCSRHGADVGALRQADLVLCDLDGNTLEGEGRPTSESNMHRAA